MKRLMLLMLLMLAGCGPDQSDRLANAGYDNGVLCAIYAHQLYVQSNIQHGIQVDLGMPSDQWEKAAANVSGSVPSMSHK